MFDTQLFCLKSVEVSQLARTSCSIRKIKSESTASSELRVSWFGTHLVRCGFCFAPGDLLPSGKHSSNCFTYVEK